MSPLSLYVHMPWCLRKCPYCDFNSHEVKTALPEQTYIEALLADLAGQLETFAFNPKLVSIFIGGGTPSLFSADSYRQLLAGIDTLLALTEDVEITLEANPGTFESAKFAAYRALGINRLSIGVQSFCDAQLSRLGRVHDGAAARMAAEQAREAGFTRLNLDLMFGLPKVPEYDALTDLQIALDLAPEHLSWYQLTLEPNTYFHRYPPPQLPDDQHNFILQQRGQALLAAAGYQQYEVSAYAKPGQACRHNGNYWRFGDYLGIGAGAHGKISLARPGQIVRTVKAKHPAAYLAAPRHTDIRVVTEDELPLEFMMNHLRLREGFALMDFTRQTGLPDSVLQPGLEHALQQGLLQRQGQQYRATELGWRFLDELLTLFVPSC
ncbi:MAG: radical SAM family heme chaperone HemW [Methylococcales bacterium]|nr:radical SAM family heme chaperone HemW [Methylococcales bacterium]